MGKNKVTDELLSTVRSIVDSRYSDMDIIRALHMANNDVTAAINIIFDTPSFKLKETPPASRKNPQILSSEVVNLKQIGGQKSNCTLGTEGNGSSCPSNSGDDVVEEVAVARSESSAGSEWWFVGSSEVSGLSTCKGRRLSPGDEVEFTFPTKSSSTSPSPGKVFGRGRQAAACSEIVRFSTKDSGEIGRIPKEWARCLLPLVRDKKVRIEGHCKSAPDALSIMDTILLSISVYINSSMFLKQNKTSLKAANNSTDETVVHPLPTLFRLLGLTPFKKAEFTPSDLYTRKRPLDPKDSFGLCAPVLRANKPKIPGQNGDEVENEESISDADLENIVGIGDSSELEEMDPPGTLQCELRPYQKQALHWMIQLEKGHCMDEGAMTLHPCWEAYRLADKRDRVIYLNAFSGDATAEFPSTLQMARGGILADAMGLGKTIMTISLLLTHSGHGLSVSHPTSQSSSEDIEVPDIADHSSDLPKKVTKFSGFDKLLKQKNTVEDGGCLIICPMTLLGQWKAEIETHAKPGSLSVYVHYGQSRPKDAKFLVQSDVVITTYGVLASEYSAENPKENGGRERVAWDLRQNPKMVKFLLQITAELENLTDLQPQDGCDDTNFSYLFKLKCERCGEVSQRETCVSLNETVPLPVGKGTANLIQKCKFCERDGMIMMHPGRGKPLTQETSEARQFAPLMIFECRGYEPVDFVFGGGWKAKSLSGTNFENIDLSAGEFVEYDEKGECPVMISNLQAAFVVSS